MLVGVLGSVLEGLAEDASRTAIAAPTMALLDLLEVDGFRLRPQHDAAPGLAGGSIAGDAWMTLPVHGAGRFLGTLELFRKDGIQASPHRGKPARDTEMEGVIEALAAAFGLWLLRPLTASPEGSTVLTPRQRAILQFAASGRTNRQIADALQVSISTVKAELSMIFQLTGATTRSDLVRIVAP